MNVFFEMGGYAAYIWPAYGVSALGLAVLTAGVMRRARKARQRLEQTTETRGTGGKAPEKPSEKAGNGPDS